MNNLPFVSIILPVHNAGQNLLPCLKSIVSQTLDNFEVICILDCPTDGSDKVANTFAKNDNRFHIIVNDTNQHIGHSRNIGIEAARGEYLAFCDHDDRLSPEFLSTMYYTAVQSKSTIVGSFDFYYKQFTDADVLNCQINRAYIDMLTFRETINSPSVWTHIYKRQYVIDNHIKFVDTKKISIEDRLFNSDFFSHMVAEGHGQATYPIIPKHLYEHGAEHTNSKVNYRLLEHVIPTLEKLIEISDRTSEIKQDDVIYEAAGRLLYNSFKKELRSFGFKKAKMHLIQGMKKGRLSETIKKHGLKYCRDLTIPKNIFLQWLSNCI